MLAAITIRRDGTVVEKPFSWSYSKLKNYRICPKRHLHTDILKDVVADRGIQLDWGDRVHKEAKEFFDDQKALTAEVEPTLGPWISAVTATPGTILVERKYAINSQYMATSYFAKDAWFRGIADLLKINGAVALALDWKTGKIKEDSEQLALMAACVFAHHPELYAIRAEFIWLQEDASTHETFTRPQMPHLWARLDPEIKSMELAAKTNNYPARQNGLCKQYCGVKSCEHNGRR